MSYCRSCGSEVQDTQDFCLNCGAAINKNTNQTTQVSQTKDTGGFGWGLLGFCVPIAGLILYLVWKDTQPKNAKAAGVGALITVILYGVLLVFYVIVIIIIMIIASSDPYYYTILSGLF